MSGEQEQVYVKPVVTPQGEFGELTQGSAGNDNADDTQYWN